MKRTIILIYITCISIYGFSQQTACKQDTVNFYQPAYRGILTWQTSANGADWTRIPGNTGDTLRVIANNSAWYRTEVIEGLCQPYYSDNVLLTVYDLPSVSLSLKDSVCVNANPFVLNGGAPGGGTYWGNGVYDSKFWPSEAGPGSHKVFYRFRDPVTHCADTAYALIQVADLVNRASAGTDVTFIAADSILLESNTAQNGIGTWSIVSGSYGHFSNIHSSRTWFIKDSTNLHFTLRWTIAGKCNSSYDDVNLTFFQLSKNPCPNAPTMTDADGNIYPTVQIGNQCWMGKNLNVGRFVTSVKGLEDHSDMKDNGIIEKYCFSNNPDSCKLYGGLYDWNEAMGYVTTEGARGICPEGWHIPTYEDWNILDENFVFNVAGHALKIGGISGFEGHFAGSRNAMGDFFSNGSTGFWWVSGVWSYEGANEGYCREIAACNGMIAKKHFVKESGLSIRCIKNSN